MVVAMLPTEYLHSMTLLPTTSHAQLESWSFTVAAGTTGDGIQLQYDNPNTHSWSPYEELRALGQERVYLELLLHVS